MLSLALLCALITETAYPATQLSSTAAGDGTPLSAAANNLVDPYTGDFSYTVPLLNVPGPNGENVPITAAYHSGIRMDEKASWLGLGWDYNPGEISRQVMGVPDDASPFPVYYAENTSVYRLYYYFGALYNNNINANSFANTIATPSTSLSSVCNKTSFQFDTVMAKSADIQTVDVTIPYVQWSQVDAQINPGTLLPSNAPSPRFRRHSVPYQSLAYDRYYVSGGVSGQLKPYNLSGTTPYSGVSTKKANCQVNNKKVQFYLDNSSTQTVSGPGSPAVNATTNRLRSGTYVKYYTNAELNTTSNLYNNSTQIGFLDYRTISGSNRRPSSDYDPDGIGAFEVTDAAGYTYHYSLPVYSYEETERAVDAFSGATVVGNLKMTFKPKRYVSSWKLTAVTGPDYQDKNTNYIVDDGDTGYWISYNYTLWNDAMLWSNTQYNYKKDQLLPNNINYLAATTNRNFLPASYSPRYTVLTGKSQVYYLDRIQTATHSAFFVKSVRLDEQGYEKVAYASAKPSSLLKLDKIVLLRNEDAAPFLSNVPISGGDLDNRFNYTNSNAGMNQSGFIGVTKYKASKNQIDNSSLKSVSFSTDYSLCKKYYFNINNTFNTTTVALLYPIPGFESSIYCLYRSLIQSDYLYRYYDKSSANYSSSDNANSGKLTLNNINFYEDRGVKITPSVDFYYGHDLAAKNPDYDPDKTDLWGYFKSDYTSGGSHYTSPVSKDDVDAWSMRRITTSMGGTLGITYESDMYHAEGFSDSHPLIPSVSMKPDTLPSLIFPLNTVNNDFTGITFEDGDAYTFLNAYKTDPITPGAGQYDFSYIVCAMRQSCGTYIPEAIANGLNAYYTNFMYGVINPTSIPSSANSSYTFNYLGASGNSVGLAEEATIGNLCTNGVSGVQSQTYNKQAGYSYALLKANYLYGGGLRVKSITMTEPNRNESYTQNFSYGRGYCPLVPKRFMMSSVSGPSNFNLMINSRLAIEGVGSTVGYNYAKQEAQGRNGLQTGVTEYWFNNKPIPMPISIQNNSLMPTRTTTAINLGAPRSGTTANLSVNCNPPAWNYIDYRFDFTLVYNNKNINLLGKLMKTAPFGGPVTEYEYTNANYVTEAYAAVNNAAMRDEIGFYLSKSCVAQGNGVTWVSGLNHDDYVVNSKYMNYDCFLSSTVKTVDGISIRERIISRDPATGQPLITKTIDPTKGIYISRNTPAYQNSSYAVLGLKADTESNKNQPSIMETGQMIKYPYTAQVADDNANNSGPGQGYIVAETKTTFTNVYPVRAYTTTGTRYATANQTKPWYRAQQTFNRLLDDVTAEGTGSPVWRQTSEGTLYDADFKRLEESGLNDRRASTKWGYNNRYSLASISNANYTSYTFSSFEDQLTQSDNSVWFGGELNNGQMRSGPVTGYGNGGAALIVAPHTGNYLARVPASYNGPVYSARQMELNRTYVAKIWINAASPDDCGLMLQLTGTLVGGGGVNTTKYVAKNDPANLQVGDWLLATVEIDVPNLDPASTPQILVTPYNSGTTDAYFDDLSFHPKDAVMTGYVYNEKTGLVSATLDNENFASILKYDEAGRVLTTYRETKNGIIKLSDSRYFFSKP